MIFNRRFEERKKSAIEEIANFENQPFLSREMSEEEACDRAKFDLRIRDFE